MRQKSGPPKETSERVVKDIRRATRKRYSAEEKIRIVLDGLRGEDSIAGLCRREGIAQGLYYSWSKEFLEAGKKRLAASMPSALDRLALVCSRLAASMPSANGFTAVQSDPQVQGTLLDEAERLERALSERSAEFRADYEPVTLDQLRPAIPRRAALVEIVRYQVVDPRAPDATKVRGEARYAAYVLRRVGEAAWVDLGEAETVERLVEGLRTALSDKSRGDVGQLAVGLWEKVLSPVLALTGDADELLISPDGALNLIPFGALVDEQGRYLLERYTFMYLSSGRELLRLQLSEPSQSSPLVMANPHYALRGPARDRHQWSLLPYTLDEAEAVEELLDGAKVLSWDNATEKALRELRGPEVLHIATHGYFEAQAPEVEFAVNPLLRSGLVLAGANGPPEEHDDGIMTALELSGLDLWGTRLVVLSACETGLGEVQAGEGVFGLRRALALAGAECQVISLWQVSSSATRDLMKGYYELLNKGMGRAQALRAVQLEMLARDERSHPYYWAAFIPSGDWRPLPAASGDVSGR